MPPSSSFSPFTTQSLKQVYLTLSSSPTGLTSTRAAGILRTHGPNTVAVATITWQTVLLRQFRSSFVYLLILASAIALVLGETINAIMILAFITIDVILGFTQEYRSEHTVQLLRRFTTPTVTVRRDNKNQVVPTPDLVPGDIVLLTPGSIIPADLRFITTLDLIVDESVISGESAAVPKTATSLRRPAIEAFRAQNIGFSGTTVVTGRAAGIVIATGSNTFLGSISTLASNTRRVSKLETGINQYSSFILRLVAGTLAIVFFANLALKGPHSSPTQLLIFSIALAVSVIPEALPVVVTFCLSRGALRLTRHKVVVKRLSAVEDLGGIDLLLTDKTGTLTENHLTVSDFFSPDPAAVLFLSCQAAPPRTPDPFDLALLAHLPPSQKPHLHHTQFLDDIPFDPISRHHVALVKYRGRYHLIARGAAETILPLCKPATYNLQPITDWLSSQGRLGHRCLAVAHQVFASRPSSLNPAASTLNFVGLISFTDPLKPSTIPAVQKARALGLTVKILTGDSPQVAGAVAHAVGLITNPAAVLTGADLDQLSTSDQHLAVEKYSVFARVSPQQKYKIVQLLQEKHICGFLGEGINDAPALKIANVAIVVQSAADVARDSADIILLQKSLGVIVDGIKSGREVFANTTKYITATLSSNFGNFYAVAVASLFIPFLPMLPLQILLLNLLSDFPMIAIAADSVDSADLARPQTYSIRHVALIATILGLVSTIFDFIFFGLFFRHSPAILQTNWFIGSILTELVFIFSVRSSRFFLVSSRPSFILVLLTIAASLVTITLPYTALGQSLFRLHPPSLAHLSIILIVIACYFVVTEAAKIAYYRFSRS